MIQEYCWKFSEEISISTAEYLYSRLTEVAAIVLDKFSVTDVNQGEW